MKRLVPLAILIVMQSALAYAQPSEQSQEQGEGDEASKLEQARLHYERGKAHHVLEAYEEAAREYLKAFELSGRPSLLFNAGQVYRLGGDLEAALVHYEHYLALEPNGPGAPVARKSVADLRAEIEEKQRREAEARERAAQERAQRAVPAGGGSAAEPLAGSGPAHSIRTASEEREDKASPGALQWISHRLSGVTHVAFDYKMRGAALMPGIGLRLGERIEVRTAGIIGATPGVFGGGVVYLGQGVWQPTIALGIPIFFSNGVRVAIRGSGGIEWRATGRIGLTAELGIEHVLDPEWDRSATIVVPILGMRARP